MRILERAVDQSVLFPLVVSAELCGCRCCFRKDFEDTFVLELYTLW